MTGRPQQNSSSVSYSGSTFLLRSAFVNRSLSGKSLLALSGLMF